MYRINGYRIRRIKGVLSLKKTAQKFEIITGNSENEQRFIAIINEISDMSDDIKNIKTSLLVIKTISEILSE